MSEFSGNAERYPVFVIDVAGLGGLISELIGDGYDVFGPTVRDDAIVVGSIHSAADLPKGIGDSQSPGSYRLRDREDGALFGFAAPAGTFKSLLFPPREVLWRSSGSDAQAVAAEVPTGPMALVGVRGCDLAALEVNDRVFGRSPFPDHGYEERRRGLFVVAVDCADPADTCFCASMGTGPRAGAGADLTLAELAPDRANDEPRGHRFLATAGTAAGAAMLERLPTREVRAEDLSDSDRTHRIALDGMTRRLDQSGLPGLLRSTPDSPRWDDVAHRCLSCGNCTAACPTCFCADAFDVPNALTGTDERVRQWGSCFELSHSYVHGGPVRETIKARYRQWLTHKLDTWWDQFGTSGCVGCGRCISWCPAGIDLTEEVAAMYPTVDGPQAAPDPPRSATHRSRSGPTEPAEDRP